MIVEDGQPGAPVVFFDPEDDPELHQNHWDGFLDLRRHGPVVFSPAGEGIWVLTDYSTVQPALSDSTRFSSAVVSGLKKNRVAPASKLIPVQLDPPEHTRYRRLLNPAFSPAVIQEQEPMVRAHCIAAIEALPRPGEIEFMTDFARQFPTIVFLELMGFPVERAAELVEWSEAVSHLTAAEDPTGEVRAAAIGNVQQLIGECLADHRSHPRDDVFGYLLTCELDGQPLSDAELLNVVMLLYIAGLDTVAGALGYIWEYLARHDAERQRIIDDPGIIPSAVEELLRYFSTVSLTRLVKDDTELGGCPMKAGDRVFAPLACANRDPAVFPQADEVMLDRSPNRHIAFGTGPHRCLGSHLARLELAVALEEWHRRIPDYTVPADADLTEKVAGLACFNELHMVLAAPGEEGR